MLFKSIIALHLVFKLSKLLGGGGGKTICLPPMFHWRGDATAPPPPPRIHASGIIHGEGGEKGGICLPDLASNARFAKKGAG